MSLDYNYGDCDKSRVHIDLETGQPFGATYHLIFLAMSTGLHEITIDNLEEWDWRLTFLARINGSVDVSMEDVRDHVGLRTNASSVKNRKKFIANVIDTVSREVDYDIIHKREEHERSDSRVSDSPSGSPDPLEITV